MVSGQSTYTYPLQLEGPQPVFIVSPGRTGSTLLRKMLMAGGEIHFPPESDDFLPETITEHLDTKKLSWLLQSDAYSRRFEGSALSKFWDLNADELKNHLLETPIHQQNLFSKLWAMHDLHRAKINPEAIRIGDKTPLLSEWIEWLHVVSPGSPFVFIVRNLFDTVASRKKAFGESNEQAFKRYSWSWKAIERFKSRNPSLVTDVIYEDLVHDSEATLRKVCQSFELSYSHAMLKPGQVILGDDSLPHHSGLSKNPNTQSIGKGKQELSDREQEQLRKWAKQVRLPINLYR